MIFIVSCHEVIVNRTFAIHFRYLLINTFSLRFAFKVIIPKSERKETQPSHYTKLSLLIILFLYYFTLAVFKMFLINSRHSCEACANFSVSDHLFDIIPKEIHLSLTDFSKTTLIKTMRHSYRHHIIHTDTYISQHLRIFLSFCFQIVLIRITNDGFRKSF